MDERNGKQAPRANVEDWHAQAPRVSDALRKGTLVSVTTWGGQDMTGLVCDWEQNGLLLDVREPEQKSTGYMFLPWSSVQHVQIQEVMHRRVKFLPT